MNSKAFFKRAASCPVSATSSGKFVCSNWRRAGNFATVKLITALCGITLADRRAQGYEPLDAEDLRLQVQLEMVLSLNSPKFPHHLRLV
jgi:hypothetical protein